MKPSIAIVIVPSAFFVVIAVAAYLNMPDKPPAPVETPRTRCVPKFKVGDTVQTVLPANPQVEELYYFPGHIVIVYEFVDKSNSQCIYEVSHYQSGERTTWRAWEFELRPK
jgi:hypothetical protein